MEHSNLKEVLGINVKFYRLQNKLTQEQLAEKSDISTRYVSDIENANANISLDKLERVASALNVECYKLLEPINK